MVLLGDRAQLDGSSWASHVVAVTWFLGLESREGETGLCIQDGALTQPVADVACGWELGMTLTTEPAHGLAMWLRLLME